MIKFEETTYKEFGRCMRMYNDYIELYATLDFGPRIIHFSKLGGENMMFNDPERAFNQDKNKELFAEKFGEDLGTWKIYGGHRLWPSPEGLPRSYYPDNQLVEFIAEGNTLTLTPPAQRWNQQQHEIKIVMSEDSNLERKFLEYREAYIMTQYAINNNYTKLAAIMHKYADSSLKNEEEMQARLVDIQEKLDETIAAVENISFD